jgi:hypothetical protein
LLEPGSQRGGTFGCILVVLHKNDFAPEIVPHFNVHSQTQSECFEVDINHSTDHNGGVYRAGKYGSTHVFEFGSKQS